MKDLEIVRSFVGYIRILTLTGTKTLPGVTEALDNVVSEVDRLRGEVACQVGEIVELKTCPVCQGSGAQPGKESTFETDQYTVQYKVEVSESCLCCDVVTHQATPERVKEYFEGLLKAAEAKVKEVRGYLFDSTEDQVKQNKKVEKLQQTKIALKTARCALTKLRNKTKQGRVWECRACDYTCRMQDTEGVIAIDETHCIEDGPQMVADWKLIEGDE